ncbi:Methyltransferase type 11 [Ferroglobus placidus DSM 10642]|uniref:Methyltransferase type 11 n=1 Tax=Ferroglobus placidus (strain DSM 10642 / AEDII12DO) TaxID=589924 RepID=D3S291_FERPA|nr:class I SAM-dependent methyltransferase [Ferroglobus placidus]ADC66582.1 Methyltransferase type 11 [Ferroglobus placidus DSM 10642]
MWEVFEGRALEYDEWYERNREIFEREVRCLKELVPKGLILEVGVGTGRFAEKFSAIGIDASLDMLRVARKRVEVVRGDASFLPFKNEVFDAVLLIVTICFLENPKKAVEEIHRVLKRNGYLIIGFVPKNSALGKLYEEKGRKGHRFYSAAKFYTLEEIEEILDESFEIVQISGVDVLSRDDFLCVKAKKA